MASKIVTIKRSYNNLPSNAKIEDSEVSSWISNSLKTQVVKNSTVDRVYTGLGVSKNGKYDYQLEQQQLRILLPEVIDVDFDIARPVAFKRACNDFYHTLIGYVSHEGLDLEIGMTADNDKPAGKIKVSKAFDKLVEEDEIVDGVPTGKKVKVTKTRYEEVEVENMPLNLRDYLMFKALFENRDNVAKNNKEAGRSDIFEFYIYDEEFEQKELLKGKENIAKAHAYYSNLKDDISFVKRILYLVGIPRSKDETTCRLKLSEFYEKNPERFISIASDPNFNSRVKLKEWVDHELIYTTGESDYRDFDSNEPIADSEEDMIKWINNPSNESYVKSYNVRLREKLNKARVS